MGIREELEAEGIDLPKNIGRLSLFGIVALAAIILGSQSYKTVPAGHVGVATVFGQVQEVPYKEGFHFPVNPLIDWVEFDVRQKTHKETAAIPTRDQLTTKMDVSVQYRFNGALAPDTFKNTGTIEQAIAVHMVPTLRALMREGGSSVTRAEDFFLDETRTNLADTVQAELTTAMAPKGIDIEAVLIRDVTLPTVLTKAIEQKKEREQAVEKQKAELARFETEQQQKVAAAEAELQAAKHEASKKRELADAEAYAIKVMQDQLARSPRYIELVLAERWDGVRPKVETGGEGGLLLNVGGLE